MRELRNINIMTIFWNILRTNFYKQKKAIIEKYRKKNQKFPMIFYSISNLRTWKNLTFVYGFDVVPPKT